MFSGEITVLLATAASLGFIHTLIGPDHYLPFIVMSRAGKWSLMKTMVVTLFSGIGHILSSVVLGFVGVALGIAVGKLEAVESFRGDLAGWALITFGLVYGVWGLRRALHKRKAPHSHIFGGHHHVHTHEDGLTPHPHEDAEPTPSMTPWVLFTVFVLGPCEPLIPLLMYPAAKHNIMGVVMVASVFGAVTIATMMSIVLATSLGMHQLKLGWMERYTHALAGGAICMCGVAIQFLGL